MRYSTLRDVRQPHLTGKIYCSCCGKGYLVEQLIAGLECLNEMLGSPLYLTSGYRCKEHNKRVGGHPKSRHLAGEAADISHRFLNLYDIYWAAMEIPCFKEGGVGIYPDKHFIHIDVRGYKKRWAKKGGVYIPFEEGLEYMQSFRDDSQNGIE